MPEIAWGRLIRHIMAEKGVKSQEDFADEVGISTDTMTRWLSDQPNVPSAPSQEKVARYYKVSQNKLRFMWAEQMRDEYEPYQFETGFRPSEVREPKAVYGGPGILVRAKAMARWDLRSVPPDLAPPLHLIRGMIEDLVDVIETFHAEAISKLEALMLQFEELYEAAKDTAEKAKSDRKQ